MHPIKRWTKAIASSVAEFWPEIATACMSTTAARIAPRLPAKPQGLARLAGMRLLASDTVDGCILEGASARAGAKFTIPNGLPNQEGERRLIIENEPHNVDGFSGEIPAGYGKGTKTLMYHGPVIVKIGNKTSVQTADYHFHNADVAGPHYDLAVTGVPSQQFSLRPKQFELHFPGGPLAGKRLYVVNTIMKEGEGGRMIGLMKDRGVTDPKPDIHLKDETWLAKQSPNDWIAERKMDGSLANAAIGPDRVAFRSHRAGGSTYYDKLPALEFLSNTSRLLFKRLLFPRPVLNGTLLKVELVHENGAAKMSGILNSNADKARAYQAVNGDARAYAWDVVKYRGRDVSGWEYTRRRGLLEKIVGQIRQCNSNWHAVEKARPGETPLGFYRRITSDRRGLPWSEGVVVKNRNNPKEWYKVKASDAYDLPISKFVPGGGKYAGSLGAIEVVNPESGEVGEVGSLAVPDEYRQWLWDNQGGLTGAVARVRAMDITDRGVPRAGVLLGLHESKGSDQALALLASKEISPIIIVSRITNGQ